MIRRVLQTLGWFVALGLGWHVLVSTHILSPAAFARPVEALGALPRLFLSSQHLPDLLATTRRALLAFLLSVPAGILAGVVVHFMKPVRQSGEFTLDFLRSIPATALAPLFLSAFGIGDAARVALGCFSSGLAIALSVTAGLSGGSRTRSAVVRLMGLRSARRILLVDLPESMPQVFVGLRTGISLALILVVVSEMLVGGNAGLGRVISDTAYSDDKGLLFATIIVAGALGYLLNVTLVILDRWLFPWRLQR